MDEGSLEDGLWTDVERVGETGQSHVSLLQVLAKTRDGDGGRGGARETLGKHGVDRRVMVES